MGSVQMRTTIDEELRHIPRGSFQQNMLRAVYNVRRSVSLAGECEIRMTAREVLQESLATIRRDSPEAQLTYDTVFFATR